MSSIDDTARLDPRIARTREVVLAAAAEVVKERGYGGTTIEAVADRCGVARSTIYRHWGEKADLVIDAMKTNVVPSPMPDTGSVRDDLIEILSTLSTWLADETSRRVVMSMVSAAARDPRVAELHAMATRQRRALIESAVQRGVDRGELPDDLDTAEAVVDLVAPIIYRSFILHEEVEPDYSIERVDRWLRCVRGS